MRIHTIQHVPFEDSDYMKTWAARQSGVHITRSLLCDDEELPDVDQFDWLTILGGPMSVYQEEDYPWLVAEKELVKRAIDTGKIVLGICLGHQLIAEVLGGTVKRNAFREIGWWPVNITDAAMKQPLFAGIPHEFTCIHWHSDTASLPKGAVHLASSEACSNQAFIYGDRVIGLQFHLEFGERTIRRLIEKCRHELEATDAEQGKYIQQESELIRPQVILEANQLMDVLLENIMRHFGNDY